MEEHKNDIPCMLSQADEKIMLDALHYAQFIAKHIGFVEQGRDSVGQRNYNTDRNVSDKGLAGEHCGNIW